MRIIAESLLQGGHGKLRKTISFELCDPIEMGFNTCLLFAFVVGLSGVQLNMIWTEMVSTSWPLSSNSLPAQMTHPPCSCPQPLLALLVSHAICGPGQEPELRGFARMVGSGA